MTTQTREVEEIIVRAESLHINDPDPRPTNEGGINPDTGQDPTDLTPPPSETTPTTEAEEAAEAEAEAVEVEAEVEGEDSPLDGELFRLRPLNKAPADYMEYRLTPF